MIYNHDIEYIQMNINDAMEVACMKDSRLHYDPARIITGNLRPSMNNLQIGSIHSPLLIPSGIEFAVAKEMDLEPSESPLPLQFCRGTLSRYQTFNIGNKKFKKFWTRENCILFGYESHILLQPGTFAMGHSALLMKNFFYKRGIGCKLDPSMIR